MKHLQKWRLINAQNWLSVFGSLLEKHLLKEHGHLYWLSESPCLSRKTKRKDYGSGLLDLDEMQELLELLKSVNEPQWFDLSLRQRVIFIGMPLYYQ
jgi:hypothetical protein